MTARSKQLGKSDWTAAGLLALAGEGPASIRAEKLARDIGTTKGSFYWHFKDVPAFCDEMLEGWKLAATARLKECVSATVTVDALWSEIAIGDAALERALRAWAISYPPAARALADVDAKRLTLISKKLDVSRERAEPIYRALIGYQMARDVEKAALLSGMNMLLGDGLNIAPSEPQEPINEAFPRRRKRVIRKLR